MKKEIIFKCAGVINAIPFNNKLKGKCRIENNGSILINCRIISKGESNQLVFHEGGVYRNCEFVMLGSDNRIEFGQNCHATAGSFYIEDSFNEIISGYNTEYAGKIHIACTESTKIIIGSDCLFSSDIVIRSGDSHSIIGEDGNRLNFAKDIQIGNHVWVGYRSLITKGVVLSDNTVVGTGSIVTRQFSEKGILLVGNPAVIKRKNISWRRERVMQ